MLELRSSVGHTVMSDATTGNAAAREQAAAPADKVEEPAVSDTRSAEASKPSEDAKPIEAAEAPKESLKASTPPR